MGKRRVLTESEIKPRIPQDYEVLGIVEKLLGNERVLVKCADGYTRLCRIRGKMKRKVWIRINDIVLISPWDFQVESRGDITHRYRKNQVDWLKKNGFLRDFIIT